MYSGSIGPSSECSLSIPCNEYLPMNLLVIPTLAIAYLLSGVAMAVFRSESRIARWILLALAVPLAVPAILFVVYYLHCFDNAAWFYQFRALPLSELTAGGIGLLAGSFASVIRGRRGVIIPLSFAFLTLGIIAPHIKPLIAPLPASCFQNRWNGEVCLQSTGSSCGLASAASILRAVGIDTTEAEIAGKCFTYRGGTESWYLARFMRSRGFDVRFVCAASQTSNVPVPSIAGVRVGGFGHFIPIISETGTTFITGDPLVGRQEWPKDEIRRHFNLTGFFMEIRRR